MTRTQRGVFAAVAAVIAVVAVAVLAASGGGSSAPARAAAVLTVVDGRPDGGVQLLDYGKGDHVELSVSSDTAEVVHVHGYGLREPLRVGSVVHLGFVADLEGEYRIELERTRQQIAVLRVHP
jgi:hypothetical protein